MSTIIKLLDIMVIFRKHILTPRARTQLEMDGFLIGRRCNLSKYVFVCNQGSVHFPLLLSAHVPRLVGPRNKVLCWKVLPDLNLEGRT